MQRLYKLLKDCFRVLRHSWMALKSLLHLSFARISSPPAEPTKLHPIHLKVNAPSRLPSIRAACQSIYNKLKLRLIRKRIWINLLRGWVRLETSLNEDLEKGNQQKCNFLSRIHSEINFRCRYSHHCILLFVDDTKMTGGVSWMPFSRACRGGNCLFSRKAITSFTSCLSLESRSWHFANSIFGLHFGLHFTFPVHQH